MKKLLLLISFTFFLISCQKDNYLIPNSEVPKWLKERIAQDEKAISSNPQSGLDVTAWIRYKYNDNYYFEYRNGLSNGGPEIYTYDGIQIMLNQDPYLNFNSEKCCKQFVWKGPNYLDY